MPIADNEPYLSSALAMLADLTDRLAEAGFPPDKIMLAGFSQGACLSLEFVALNARRYGGVVGLSGGLIGPDGTPRDYAGSLAGTPIFLGCSDVDFHIPKERVQHSTEILRNLGGDVTERLYEALPAAGITFPYPVQTLQLDAPAIPALAELHRAAASTS